MKGVRREKGADGVNTRQRSQGGPSRPSPGQEVEGTGGLDPRLSLWVKLPPHVLPQPLQASLVAQREILTVVGVAHPGAWSGRQAHVKLRQESM